MVEVGNSQLHPFLINPKFVKKGYMLKKISSKLNIFIDKSFKFQLNNILAYLIKLYINKIIM